MPKFIIEIEGRMEIEAENLAAANTWTSQHIAGVTVAGERPAQISLSVVRACRFCGCTEFEACVLDNKIIFETCAWAAGELDVCTNPVCLARLEVDYAADKSQLQLVKENF